MDWAWYLFSFKGRITRGNFWQAMLVILGGMGLLAAFVAIGGKLLGGPTLSRFNVCDIFATVDPGTYRGLSRNDLVPTVAHVIGTPLFAWVFVATCVKRLHDRGRSAWWLLPFFIIPGLVNQFADRAGETSAVVAGTVMAVLHFWGFIELYCLAGNDGANRFGPAPRPKAQAAASIRTDRVQQREVEFVPHIGRATTIPLSTDRRPALQRLTSLFR
ncbi:MAG: hypothetical protein V7634_1335 [Bradyrhizobium sp.]